MKIQSVPMSAPEAAASSAPSMIQTTMRTSNKAAEGSGKARAIAKLLGTSVENALPSAEEQESRVQAAQRSYENQNRTQSDTNIEAEQSEAGETLSTQEVEAPAEDTTEDTVGQVLAPKTEEPKVTSKPLSQQYAILARKEQALRQREAQLKARESALAPKSESKPVEASAPSNAFDPSKFVSKDMLAKNPFGVLNEMGLSYDKLVDLVTNGPSHEQISTQTELQALKEELKALKAESESTRKTFETSQEQQNAQALSMMKKEASKLIANDESFEMLKMRPDAIDDVVKLIERTYEEDGEFLSVADAASAIEEALAEEAMKYARAKKIQSRMQPAAKPAAAQTNGQAQKPGQLKTLTNSLGTSRPMTARERAIAAMEGRINKS